MKKREFKFSPFSDLIVFGFMYTKGKTEKPSYFGRNYSLVVAIGDKAELEFEENGKKIIIPAGKAALIAPYTIWNVKYAGEYFFVWFDGEIAEKTVGVIDDVVLLPIGRIIENQISDVCADDGEEFSDLLKASAIVLSALSFADGNGKERQSGSGNKVVDRFISYVEENYNGDLKSADVCEEFNLTLSALNHTVKRVLGVSPHRYLIATRIKKAKELLRNTDMSVESISHLVGYEYCGHFCNEFKKNVGITPAEYRKKIYI